MNNLRVGLLFGGPSPEHEVSIRSAQSVAAALEEGQCACIPIYVTRRAEWFVANDLVRDILATGKPPKELPAEGGLFLRPGATGTLFRPAENPSDRSQMELDLFFPLIHGPYGEDGTLQGILEMLDVPYVGSGVLASALCMDKGCAKTVLAEQGIPQVEYDVIETGGKDDLQSAAHRIEENISYPCFIKPARGGSSIGVSRVARSGDLMAALREAVQYDPTLVVERAVDAREIECSVLGNSDPQASRPGEIIPVNRFYDYEAKYLLESELIIPAALPEAQEATVRELALRSYSALQCRGYARVDFLVDRGTDSVYVNEINTIPGFTRISMFPKLWEASGLSISKLFERMIQFAFDDYEERRKGRRRLSSSVSLRNANGETDD